MFFGCTLVKAQKVYAVDFEFQADVTVFVVDYENQADLNVYVVDYEIQVGTNDGRWYFTQYAHEAEKKIYFVEYKIQADLTIHYVEYAHQAGWLNPAKKSLMSSADRSPYIRTERISPEFGGLSSTPPFGGTGIPINFTKALQRRLITDNFIFR